VYSKAGAEQVDGADLAVRAQVDFLALVDGAEQPAAQPQLLLQIPQQIQHFIRFLWTLLALALLLGYAALQQHSPIILALVKWLLLTSTASVMLRSKQTSQQLPTVGLFSRNSIPLVLTGSMPANTVLVYWLKK
jgi:hypothetical protein